MRLPLWLPFLLLTFLAPGAAPTRAQEPGTEEYFRVEKDLLTAQAFLNGNRFSVALRMLKGVLDKFPENLRALDLYAEVFLRAKKPAKALPHLKKIASIDPKFTGIGQKLTPLLEAELNATRKKRSYLEGLVRAKIYSPPLLYELARYYRKRRASDKVYSLADSLKEWQRQERVLAGHREDVAKLFYLAGKIKIEDKAWVQALAYMDAAVSTFGNLEGLREATRKLREKLERDAEPKKLLGDREALLGNFDKAMTLYKEALEVYPDWSTVRNATAAVNTLKQMTSLLEEAETFAAQKKYPLSLQKLDLVRAHKIDYGSLEPTHQELLIRAENLELQFQNQKDAIERRERENSRNFAKFYSGAEAAVQKENWAEAVRLYEEALRIQPNDVKIQVKLEEATKKAKIDETFVDGVEAYKRRKYSEARKLFESVRERSPTYPKLARFLALVYFYEYAKSNNPKSRDSAENYALEVLKGNHQDVDINYVLGVINQDRSELEKSKAKLEIAIRHFEKVEEKNPTYEDVEDRLSTLRWKRDQGVFMVFAGIFVFCLLAAFWRKNRGAMFKNRFLSKIERWSRKEKWKNLAGLEDESRQYDLDKTQKQAVAVALAQAFYHLEDWNRAVNWCQNALQGNRDSPELKVLMGRVYFESGTISQDILKFLIPLYEVEPENEELLKFICLFCLDKQVINEQTMPLLRQLSLRMPEHDKLRRLLIKGYLRNEDRTAQALALYRVELERDPTNFEIRYYVAADALKSGRVEEAIQHCEEILNQKLNHPPTHEVLRKAYAKLGKLEELARIYQGILETDPYNPAVHDSLRQILEPPK